MKPDAIEKPKNRLLMNYLVGFVLSLVLTGAAYLAVTEHLVNSHDIGAFVVKLAILQIAVQLFFFLHLGQEARPKWKLTAFFFMLVVLVILIFGSLWIMQNLNYNMSSHDADTYIIRDEGVRP